MLSFIIKESMLKTKGVELMFDFLDRIYDDYMLETFNEFKLQRKYFDENVVRLYCKFISRNLNLREYKLHKDKNLELEKLTDEEIKEKIKQEITDKVIEIEFVSDFFSEMDKTLKLDTSLEFECDEDLFRLKKAFLKAYDLFYHSGYMLED